MNGAVSRPADLLPATGIPILYFAWAHLSLASAFATLLVLPGLPAGFFHHPRMIAVIHLVTLGWISSSILGAFYIVAPLALGMPFRSGRTDRVAFGAYAIGVSGMVSHFWLGEYNGMVWSALFVAAAIAHVGIRAWRGLPRARVPGAVKLHVALAFANVVAAAIFGMLIAMNRVFGWFTWAPMSVAFAHAHLAAVGFAVMMVVGLSYRLIPMIVPAAMPKGRSLAWSAVLLEIGVITLAIGLVRHSWMTSAGALIIVAGLAAFVRQVRRIIGQRRPPPAALPRPDWATWQTHGAFAWLIVAAICGLLLVLPLPFAWMIPLGWVYGVAASDARVVSAAASGGRETASALDAHLRRSIPCEVDAVLLGERRPGAGFGPCNGIISGHCPRRRTAPCRGRPQRGAGADRHFRVAGRKGLRFVRLTGASHASRAVCGAR
jgi:hypothetical protein